jgi:hypothetical protein
MSNELVLGGGAIVPASTGSGGAVGDGDISLERGPAPVTADSEGLQKVKQVLGIDINPEQIKKVLDILQQHRQAVDKQQKAATIAKLRSGSEWGKSYDQRLRRIYDWLATLPESLAEEIRCARDQAGDMICSKPAVLRLMYQAASEHILGADNDRDRAAAVSALQAEWKGSYHSHVATVKRYLDTLPRSVKEALLNARDDNDVALSNDPAALKWLLKLARPALVNRPPAGPAPGQSAIDGARLHEIEGWMSTSDARYWKDEAVQLEYRSLLGSGATPSVAHTADADVAKRIAEIEKWMGARKGSTEYKKYWDDPAVQREYAELLGRRDQHRR